MKNSRGTPDSIVTIIDIGTTKICVLLAQHISHGHLEIIGIGKAQSQGLARGVVIDIAEAVQSIKTAIKEAELMSGAQVESAYIGISGSHIQAFNSQGVVGVKHKEIRQNDIAHVINAAKAVPLPDGQKILHVIPQFFTIDGNHKVRDPLGMYGVRLEAQVHIITGAVASVQNLVRCCEMAGIKVIDLILEPLASAAAILSNDEEDLGCFMLDIGGGTSDFAFYQQGSIHYTKIIPIAGNLFTQDIALCLRTTINDAERIKKLYGYAYKDSNFYDEKIEIEKIQGGETQIITKSQLIEVLRPRAQELFKIISQEIGTNQLQAPAGLVLTGGGSLLNGIVNLAEDILKMPVRIGSPKISFGFREALESPAYATSYGLLLYVMKKYDIKSLNKGPFFVQVFSRMKSWASDFF